VGALWLVGFSLLDDRHIIWHKSSLGEKKEEKKKKQQCNAANYMA
jgi:hypothetical protein